MSSLKISDVLFPHDIIRPSQELLLRKISEAITNGTNLIIHAPTGLGKTAASLSPALKQSLEKDLTIFFLTSRHTQHEIAMKTLEMIKKKHNKDFIAVDIIGKKWMCLQPGVERLPSSEFTEFCKALRKDNNCQYYLNLKKGEKLTPDGEIALQELRSRSPVRNKDIIMTCSKTKICPYYASMELAKKARVIIGDYYYVFHPKIRDQFFKRSNKFLEESVIIVDEAHNLPDRIKNLASARLSSIIIARALREAEKQKLIAVQEQVMLIKRIFDDYTKKAESTNNKEILVSKKDFINRISIHYDYDSLSEELIRIGDIIREEKQVSYLGSIGMFLEAWTGTDDGFTRIFSIKKTSRGDVASLNYKCLDPSIISAPVIRLAHSVIMMSGTLTPTSMYKELMGFEQAEEITFKSPFPENNRLNLIIPKTSTKYTLRGEDQYKNIAEVLSKIIRNIPGNSAVFFPSYYLLSKVNEYFKSMTEKTIFVENPGMNTAEKQSFIDNFRSYKETGAVLLGVITGSFGEGIDLPGDELKGVIIVGLPLQKPDLETESLIKYYDEKFGKGWDYGYLFPAFNKTMQSAGRCIRSETDRGVIIFLDERYAWPQYKRCFPEDSNVKITLLYEKLIKDFFNNK